MSDNRSPARQKRMDNLDLMKTLGILMVLSLHVPLWDVDFIATPTVSRAVQYALRLVSEGVPVFVAVNGFLLLFAYPLMLIVEKTFGFKIVAEDMKAIKTFGQFCDYIETKIG